MTERTKILHAGEPDAGLAGEGLSLLLGAGFTLMLFAGLARFENRSAVAPIVDFADLRAAAVPLEPPPPPVVVRRSQPAEDIPPLAGLELGASDSPVKIKVVPPDFDAIMPANQFAPPATIRTMQLYTSFKPKVDEFGDFDRVFQPSEVDQRPTAIYRATPDVPGSVRETATQLRVVLLVVIDTAGLASSVRVFKSSGNLTFDAIIAKSVQEEWSFSPAIKKGRKVKCLVEQPVTVKWGGGSRFSL